MGSKTFIFVGITALAIILLLGMLTFFFGLTGVWEIIKILLIGILILGFLIMLGWVVYYFILKKHKFDATAVNKKKLIMAGTIQCPMQIKNKILRLTGDKGHSFINFGKIVGFLQIQVLTKEKVLDSEGNQKYELVRQFGLEPEKKALYTLSNSPQDVFIVSTAKNWLASFFEDLKVIRVDPKDHDSLIGDVNLFGLNLVPLSEYYYLNTDYLDARKIDSAILYEAERGIMFEMLKDVKSVVDQAINLDSRHRKNIEEKHLVEVPQLQNVGVQTK